MPEPIGPLPPSVYRRRRAVALGVVVVLLGLLTWGVAALLGGSAESEDATASVAGAPITQTPRPAAFAAAERAERARRADDSDGAASPSPRARATQPPGPPDQASTVLPAPPGVIGRGLLPGAVLGPLPSSLGPSAAPGGASAPAPTSGRAPAPAAAGPAPAGDAGAGGARVGQAPPRCADDVLTVVARTDEPRYASGQKPVFSLVVRNTGPVACVRDLDAARQAVAVVRKPGDGVWGSNDCAPGDTDDVRVLRPGEEAVFSVRWSGRTSQPGCPVNREVVPPGRYQLLARLDDTISAPAPFTLEG